ncbi:MAG: Uma2 family endonuclease [Niameybacter sp.]|uniref:Uma2 family endonuclease n=1 Tax=Niameybacter sp. TaxID=2033640 RepID=UPI002FCBDDA6
MPAVDYKHYKEEKIDGKICLMSPIANPKHGETIGNLYLAFATYLKGKQCKVFTDNIAIFLDAEKNNYVVPDLSVLCDPAQFSSSGYHGIPSLLIEVISRSNIKRDRIEKFELYQKFGVKEYWLVDYVSKTIEQYVLVDHKYILERAVAVVDENELEIFTEEERAAYTTVVKPTIFEDLEVDIKDIF